MNDPIEFNADSISFSRISSPQPVADQSSMNSINYTEIGSFDLEPINFNLFDGTLEARLNRELNGCISPIQTSPVSAPQVSPIPQQPSLQTKMQLQAQPSKNYSSKHQSKNEPLVLHPFRSVYDVELAVRQLRAFEACAYASHLEDAS